MSANLNKCQFSRKQEPTKNLRSSKLYVDENLWFFEFFYMYVNFLFFRMRIGFMRRIFPGATKTPRNSYTIFISEGSWQLILKNKKFTSSKTYF